MTAAAATRTTIRDLLDDLLDDGLRSWDAPAGPPPREADTPEYRRALADARARSGADESVLTGEGALHGRRVAVVAGDFAFLAGSIGTGAATRILEAVERATAERLPLIGITASGGTRMQEGTPAFVRMAGIAAAIADHKSAGLPYVTYLRHPTTGGVLASWGSLGHVTLAEPGALIGFLGPKVYAALHGEPFPDGVQRAEHLHRCGLVDAVVEPENLRDTLARILGLLDARPSAVRGARGSAEPSAPHPGAWESVTATRRPDRPGLRELLALTTDTTLLNATDAPSASHGAVLALTRIGRTPCVLFGHDRRAQRSDPPGPGVLRLARRAMGLAAGLGLPLVTVIDTPGAALSPEAEEQGTAREIAECLATMAQLETVSVSVVLGQGTGGAALALLPADRTVAAKHAWITPLPPEGASAILHGTTDKAPEIAEWQQIRAIDLLRHGVVDVVVADDPDPRFPASMIGAIEEQLHIARAAPPSARRAARRRRWRGLPPM
ncbi:carboxyl transferase domain-containing protein [Pseudonocardia halophobica]|uniref:Acetyl-CoA carboxylase carboxyltransferase subunit beta n=1 Tax=Pseudonocardia halophobica TaxID=29401 RepID=A0A9W6L5B1_9PSEU|nr:carboxyl transferase domain-containing protein [Pseudonocardia halophobica]GLL12365.1 acetyl-CoA carboxylase carboxyltransferase subunit beta [Pseudonocardia halophobica]